MEDDNLPVLHESEEPSSIEKLRTKMARRDGYLSPSNATVPQEASDVGMDRANPSAGDLGYERASVDEIVEFEGKTYFCDGRISPTAELGIDSDCVVDVEEWA